MPVPLLDLVAQYRTIRDEVRAAVAEVLESQRGVGGPQIVALEKAGAEYCRCRHAIGVSSGTDALLVSLMSLDIGRGDEVITTPFTFFATVGCIVRVGAKPVFVDIDPKTYNIDPSQIEAAVTKRTKAILPVHLFGQMADMDPILAAAEKHGLAVIEDACHSWGSRWKGKGTGALGNAGAFSFQVSKNIAAGEGGIVVTDDEELGRRVRGFTNCDRDLPDPWYYHYRMGSNYRMTEFQAAVLLAQLGRLEKQTAQRAENADLLNEELSKIPGIHVLRWDERVTRRAHHIYQVRYVAEECDGPSRERFMAALNAEGIPCYGGYSQPLYRHTLFRHNGDGPDYCPLSCPYYARRMDYTKVNCPNAERICREAIWIRQSMLLGTRKDTRDIVRAFRKVFDRRAELQAG